MDAVTRWRAFERLLVDRGLGWGLRYLPAQLRYARDGEHPYGADLGHLLPADYRAFVAEVGYPVLFYDLDREGFSFLPPEAMAVQSLNQACPAGTGFVFPRPRPGRPTRCMHAFFAGYDLPDYQGYSFGPADGGEVAAWIVEDGGPVVAVGTFTEWLDAELAAHEEHIAGLDEAKVAELRAEHAEPDGRTQMGRTGQRDPHRLLEYSLGGSYDQAPYTPADLDLTWVGDAGAWTAGRSAVYGLIDGSGRWRIPPDTRFRVVRPFRDGVAEVVVDTGDIDGWTRIRPDGSIAID
jgi:hypothetical protein